VEIFKLLNVLSLTKRKLPNGSRYPLVGGTRQRHFAGTNSQSRKLLENAPTPTSRVHALLDVFKPYKLQWLESDTAANLNRLWLKLFLGKSKIHFSKHLRPAKPG